MGIYAKIQNDTIVNTVVCDPDFAAQNGLAELDGLNPIPGVGWTFSNGAWTPPAPPPPTPQQDAQSGLIAMFGQTPAMQQQIYADMQLFANTPVGSTLTAEHLAALGRMVEGFGTVMQAIQLHATYTGALPS